MKALYSYSTVCRTTNRQQRSHLFPPTDPLEFVSIDIFGALPKTKCDNQYVIVITNQYFELT